MMVRRVGIGVGAGLLFLLSAPFSYAQIEQSIPFTSNERAPLTITMEPSDPAPGDPVTLSLSSSAIDLDRSSITWSANGEPIPPGPSLKQVTVIAPPLGQA